MNIFNKIIVVLILIGIVCVSIVGIFNSFVKIFKWSDLLLKLFKPGRQLNPYITALILLLVIIICIFLFVLEFYRRKAKTAVVAAVKEGTAMITLDSAANQIKESISKISGTADIVVKVLPKSNGVILNVYSKICSDCNVPEKMKEIIKGATNFAVNKLGIKVYKTNLTIVNLTNIKYEPSAVVQKEVVKKADVIVDEKTKDMVDNSKENSKDSEYTKKSDDINKEINDTETETDTDS